MTRRNRRMMGTAGLVFMSVIAACIGLAVGVLMVMGIVQFYTSG